MGCQSTKCRNCPAVMAACQLTNGLCPSCHAASLQAPNK